jgi:ATP synthase F0 subunit b
MLSFDPVNFIFMIINVLILFFLAKKFLFGRVDDIIRKRGEEIDNAYVAADRVTDEALRNKKEYETKLEATEKEAARLLDETAQKARAESDVIIKKAEAEAADILKSATEEAGRLKSAAEMARDKEVERIVFDVAARLAGQNMSDQSNSELYDQFLSNVSRNE